MPLLNSIAIMFGSRYEIGSLECIVILAAVAFLSGWSLRQQWRVRNANTWPGTEATIEPSVHFSTRDQYRLNSVLTFAFSYKVNGEYYGGRFSLLPYIAVLGDSLSEQMKGRKLQIRYDPRDPKVWFIPDKLIEGCKVQQSGELALSHSYWS